MTGFWDVHRGLTPGWVAEHSNGTEIRLSNDGSVSDTYHTFDELYRHRALLTAVLFEAWNTIAGITFGGFHPDAHKSRLHSDGSKLDGYFVVMAELPTGQVSYHYPDADWKLFHIPERERAAEWDGHTSADVLDRLERFLRS